MSLLQKQWRSTLSAPEEAEEEAAEEEEEEEEVEVEVMVALATPKRHFSSATKSTRTQRSFPSSRRKSI